MSNKSKAFSDLVGVIVFFGSLLFSVVFLLQPYLFIIKPLVEALASFSTHSTSIAIFIFTIIVMMTLGVAFIAIPYYLSLMILKYLRMA